MRPTALHVLLAACAGLVLLPRHVRAEPAAWICDSAGQRLMAPCHFQAGEEVTRTLCFTNSTPRPVHYIFRFETSLGGKPLAADEDTDLIPAESVALPSVRFEIPTGIAARVEGRMTLIASVDGAATTSAVPFTVHTGNPGAPGDFALFDPAAQLSPLMRAWGVTPSAWSRTNDSAAVLVAPEPRDKAAAPAQNMALFISGGKRAIILSTRPDWLLEHLGLRSIEVTGAVCRVVSPGEPALAGLTGDDFATPGPQRLIPSPYPAGWRPLLESGSPVASPLLEFVGTDGRGYVCLLDLANANAAESAAALVLRRLLVSLAGTAASP